VDLLPEGRPYQIVAGVDEVGRGPLAGPVVAAAVILDDARPIEGLADSKFLTAKQRHELAREIRCKAFAFAIALADAAEVDSLNVLAASLLAMERAVRRLKLRPDLVRVDGNRLPAFADEPCYRLEAVVRGDQIVPCISAASILAKVCRDRLMRRWHRKYPRYGFDRHKGYPTRAHFEALREHGPCAIHRLSFSPLRQLDLELAS
jgi:ribonuclease HII